jgi:hypothetical protein
LCTQTARQQRERSRRPKKEKKKKKKNWRMDGLKTINPSSSLAPFSKNNFIPKSG